MNRRLARIRRHRKRKQDPYVRSIIREEYIGKEKVKK